MKFQFLFLLTLLIAGAPVVNAAAAQRPKLIECSWATPTPAFLQENIRRMEADAPYDGIRIKLEAQGIDEAGNVVDCNPFTIFSGVLWQYEWFAPAVEQLKQVEFRQFTDNFLKTTVCPGVKDWFDDDAWSAICRNFGLMAQIARETGLKGICFDPEQYGSMMFRYRPDAGHSYADTLAMARQRGREWGSAVFGAYPDMTMLAFFWFSYNLSAAQLDDPEQHLLGNEGLLVPFINGVYDVLPPEAVIVDGHEYDGYRAHRPEDFYKLVYDVKTAVLKLVAPENQGKYRRQTQLGAALYLDAFFVHAPGNNWYIAPEESDRLGFFRRNLELAFKVSDSYVWTWGEQCRWWNQPFAPDKEANARKLGLAIGWEERVPGLTAAIREVKDPALAIRTLLDRPELQNLLPEGDFEDPQSEWNFWQQEELATGRCAVTPAGLVNGGRAMRLTRVANGCIIPAVPVHGGKRYLVHGFARQHGAGTPTLLIRWRDANGQFTADYANTPVTPLPGGDTGMLREFGCVITAPSEAFQLAPLFGAAGQNSEEDYLDFDDLGVYLIP